MGVLLTTAAIVVAVGVGVASERRWPLAAGHAARQALLLILYVLLPPVIFFNLARRKSTSRTGSGWGSGWWRSRSPRWRLVVPSPTRVLRLAPQRSRRGPSAPCSVVNSGYLGYPLTVALLGRDQLSDRGPLRRAGHRPLPAARRLRGRGRLRHQGAGSPRQRVRAFLTRNPPLYAAIAGLLAPSWLAPTVLVDASQALVEAILPIGFFAVGATLAEGAEHGELPLPPPMTRPVALALVARLAMVPALLILLAAPLIDLPAAYRLMSAMPSGLNGMIVSHAYGLDNRIVAEAIVWSTAIVVSAALVSLLLSGEERVVRRCAPSLSSGPSAGR